MNCLSAAEIKPYAYALYNILALTRFVGLLAVEPIINAPERSMLLVDILGEPEQLFICDSLLIILDGTINPVEYDFYARNSLTSDKAIFVYTALRCGLVTYRPEICLEFARQSLGKNCPITRLELQNWACEWKTQLSQKPSSVCFEDFFQLQPPT